MWWWGGWVGWGAGGQEGSSSLPFSQPWKQRAAKRWRRSFSLPRPSWPQPQEAAFKFLRAMASLVCERARRRQRLRNQCSHCKCNFMSALPLIKPPLPLWPGAAEPTASKWAGGNSPLISSERCKGSFIIEETPNLSHNPPAYRWTASPYHNVDSFLADSLCGLLASLTGQIRHGAACLEGFLSNVIFPKNHHSPRDDPIDWLVFVLWSSSKPSGGPGGIWQEFWDLSASNFPRPLQQPITPV